MDDEAYLLRAHERVLGRRHEVTAAREFLAGLSVPWLEKPFEMDELLRVVEEAARDGDR